MPSCSWDRSLAVTTDIVIFTIRDRRLALLLVKRTEAPFQGEWALPGGFVGPDEGLKACATRALDEQTGMSGVYLEQLYTFGDPGRDPLQRVISIAYYALVPSDRLALRAPAEPQAVGWFALEQLPPLAFDHCEIVALAHHRLVSKLTYSTIAFQFMGEKFTLSELQAVHEIILAQRVDKRNFRKWALALEQIEPTGEERRDGKHRPAQLYRLKFPGRVEIIR
ncbi:MAG: NUDIX domain-containing protein [Betaproteobacteria bacterium]|nr:NUDIX domain-containing protein [Betaproteobacteria bacterium]